MATFIVRHYRDFSVEAEDAQEAIEEIAAEVGLTDSSDGFDFDVVDADVTISPADKNEGAEA